ncbi:MAG TPA: hypothetical protein V6D28_27965 [Leptolyngbyaceae cyanobacterium]
MLQAVIIHKEQDYILIPWTSIVRTEYRQTPYSVGTKIKINTPEYFKITALGSDVQILECLVFGGESANILNKAFRRLGDAYPVVDVYGSDLIDNFLIR